MSKKSRMGISEEDIEKYEELRDRGFSGVDAESIIDDKKAMHRTMTRMFGRNGWNL